ncbi:methyltransferase domain-containing protein [Desulfolutivibrio sulfoxidireducens]|nr:methyltransferase domain-containing protein [Desulfolutivibrio sulfoxidireducens]
MRNWPGEAEREIVECVGMPCPGGRRIAPFIRSTSPAILATGRQEQGISARGMKDDTMDNPLSEWLEQRGMRAPFRYDLPLFEALNTYYADKPLVPAPREISSKGLFSQADTRVDHLLTLLASFENLECLEVGCGRGETAVRLAQRGGCGVTGVDITRYAEWEGRWSARTRFLPLDITHEAPFRAGSFDFIYSFVVLEHVVDPLAMLEKIYTLLKPKGTFYFTANLYRGPMASHRYREVFFPWPHLLFGDTVFEEYYQQIGFVGKHKPAWVNKLTHLHYIEKMRTLGLQILRCNYTRRPLDVFFYECFHDILGKYPREDLELDFIKLHTVKK